MIHHFDFNPADLDRFRRGPLAPYIGPLARLLSEQGYCHHVGMQKLRLIALLSGWLQEEQIGLDQLGERRIGEFLGVQKKALRRQRQVRHTLAQLLQELRRLQVIPSPQPVQSGPIDGLLQDYGRFLAQERGLSQVTLDNYLPIARRFLGKAFGTKTVKLNQLGGRDIHGFILGEQSAYSPKRVQLTTSALRSFLGFLYLRGQLAVPLALSVPPVATWRYRGFPSFWNLSR
jgi:integrase/recombinase XerD